MKILLISTLILLGSCARKVIKKARPVYSQEIENEFASIEKLKAIERYRLLRARNWNKYKEKSSTVKRRIVQKKIYPKKVQKRSYKKVDAIELEKEIEQNMAIFCMTHRNNSKFSNEEACVQMTEDGYRGCKDKFNDDDRSLYTCVKSKLKI